MNHGSGLTGPLHYVEARPQEFAPREVPRSQIWSKLSISLTQSICTNVRCSEKVDWGERRACITYKKLCANIHIFIYNPLNSSTLTPKP